MFSWTGNQLLTCNLNEQLKNKREMFNTIYTINLYEFHRQNAHVCEKRLSQSLVFLVKNTPDLYFILDL